MKRGWLVRMLASLLVVLLLPMTTAYMEPSQHLRVPRVISVVYDDSGSMSGDDEYYAKYAMNIFISLLDENDVLYVTMMSNEEKAVQIDLTKGADAACQQLNGLISSAGTPAQTIETAQNALLNHKSEFSSALYWLVVFTDGAFDESNAYVTDLLTSFLKKKMPNGTTPQVCYMGIGKSAFVPQINHQDYTLYPKSGDIVNEDGIVNALQDMADDISGRSAVEDVNIRVSGNTMSVDTKFPSYSIVVLQMRTDLPVKAVRDAAGNVIPVKSNGVFVQERTYGRIPDENTLTLKGVVNTLTPVSDEPLPSGTYTIEYAAPPTDVVVMTEPALVLDLEVSAADNGKTDDFSLLMCGSVNIQAKLRLWNDPNPIDQALLPAGTTYSTRLEQNGITVAEDNTSLMRLENVDIRGNNSEVKAEVLLPGIGRVYARQSIKLPSINLSADKTLVTTSLREFCAGMDGFTLKLESDQEIGQALAADANLLLDTELPLKCRKNADNTYTIYCEEQSLAPLARYGDYTVKISADSSVNIEPLTLTWHVVEPKFEITGGLGGLDSLSRLDMWKQQESALALATMTDTSSLVPDEQIYASFQLNLDGEVLNKEQLEVFGGLQLSYTGTASEAYPVAQHQLEDGTLLAMPYEVGVNLINPAMWSWLNSWKGTTGEGVITCSNEKAADVIATFQVLREELYKLLLNIMLPLLLVLLAIGYSCKKRFPKNSYIVVQQVNHISNGAVASSSVGETVKLHKTNFWSFIPFAKARVKVRNIPVYPMSKTAVGVKKSVLPRNSYFAASKSANHRGIVSIAEQDHSVRKVFHTDSENEEGTIVPITIADVLVVSSDGRSGTALTLKVQ